MVRQDLPLGDQFAQLAHAAGHTGGDLPEDTHVVILAAEHEEHLLEISDRLLQQDVQHHIVYEPDPPYNGAATAIGLYPRPKNSLKNILFDLHLLGRRGPRYLPRR